jgi:hypothetical protein
MFLFVRKTSPSGSIRSKSRAQGTDVIVAASPQGRLLRLMRSDGVGTKIRYARTRIIDPVVATGSVPVSWGEARNAKRLTETLCQQSKRYFQRVRR